MQKLAIIGGTGRVGKIVIKYALEQGYSLNVLARNPEKVPLHPNINIVKGCATDKHALEQLIEGTIAVVSTLGPSGINESIKLAKQSAQTHTNTNTKSTQVLLPLLRKHRINRFILTGGASLKHPDDRNPWFVRFMLNKVAPLVLGEMTTDRQNEFEILTNSEIDFTIARAGRMMDEVSTSPLKTSHSRFQGGNISIHSLAQFLLEQVHDTNYYGKAVYVST